MMMRTIYRNWISPQRWLERAGERAPMRIVLGLVLLTTCILLFAEDANLLPSDEEQLMRLHLGLLQTASRYVAAAITREDYAGVEDQLNALVNQHDILSAGLRENDGYIVVQTPDHEKRWADGQSNPNDPTHVRVVLSSRQRPWGQLEVVFAATPRPVGLADWWSISSVRLMVFVISGEFVLFWLYLSRMLTMLDPSSVIPNRMQLLMDTLVEGMVVLDNQGHIVMANQAIAQTAFTSAEQLIGQRLSDLPWLSGDSEAASHPWDTERSGDLQLRGVPMQLRIGTRHARRLNVNVSPILGTDAKRRGTLVTFDDQTIVEEDNAKLSHVLARFSNAGDQIRQLREQLPSQAISQLDQLEELAASARELAQLCKSTIASEKTAQSELPDPQSPVSTDRASINGATS